MNSTDVTANVSNNQYTISSISANTSLEVEFEAITHTLSITATGNGVATYNDTSVRGKTSTFTVNEGTSAVVTFTPDAGYRIKSVKVNNTDVTSAVSNGQYTISNITADASLEVEFERITYTLSITVIGNGSVSYNDVATRGKTNTFNVEEGTSATLTIAADEGYRIRTLKVNDADVTFNIKDGNYTISSVTANTSVEAIFEAIPTYTISILAIGNGNVGYDGKVIRNQSQNYSVVESSPVTVTFSPDAGYRVGSVKVNNTDMTGQISNGKLTISNVLADINIEVKFELIPPTTYTLTVKATGNGSVTYDGTSVRDKSNTFTIVEGTYVNFVLTPDEGYRVKSVKLNNADVTLSVVDNQYTTVVSSDTSIEVEFEQIICTLSITAVGNGSAVYAETAIRSKTSTFTVAYGTNAVVVFNPNEGYRIKIVKLDVTDVTSKVTDSHYTITNITADTSLEVEFERITYALSITATGNGSVSYADVATRGETNTFNVVEGSSATLVITADEGHRIKSLKVNAADVTSDIKDGTYAISSVDGNTIVEAVFEAIPDYTISILATGNGNVGYDGKVIRNQSQNYSIREGSSVTISFSPDAGYRVAMVKVNKADVTGQVVEDKLTISNIKSDTSIEVTFEAIPPTTYAMTVKATGNGSVTYNGISIRDKSNTFTVVEGTYATVTFIPDAGYRVKIVKLNNTDVTMDVVNNQYTINGITSDTTLEVEFEIQTYALTITATGNGSVTYDGITVRSETSTFTTIYGSSVTVIFAPDAGHRIKKVMLNKVDVTSNVSNNQYTVTSIVSDINIEVEFEMIPPTIYALNIVASGYGSISYNNNVIRNQSKEFSITEGYDVILTMTPDNGCRVANVIVNSADLTGLIVDGKLTITNVVSNTTVEVTFEEIPPTTYDLTITATGNGAASYDGETIRSKSSTFTVIEGAYATVAFAPDNGYHIKEVKVNNADVTNNVFDNRYTINKIATNTTLEVEFEEDIKELANDGIQYAVASYADQTVNLASGDYGQVLTVPATFTENGKEWKVVGVEANALADNSNLAAIIWNADAAFNGNVSNPNLLLYVKVKEYASPDIQNVIVDGTAESIILTDAASSNDFYCPRAFTAKRISYEHNYSMKSGYNTCQGWETLVLPFDVTQILRQSVTELVPHSTWTVGSSQRPFWLYSLTEIGWKAETAIAANTPYLIGMPNNENYEQSYNLSGYIQFIGVDVQVKASDNLPVGKNGQKRLVPNYQNREASDEIWALNVNNQWCQNTTAEMEGSAFVRNLRSVHPFEAYLTAEGAAAAQQFIPIFGNGETTGIVNIPLRMGFSDDAWYTIDGRKLQSKPSTKGVYILNGQKVVVK